MMESESRYREKTYGMFRSCRFCGSPNCIKVLNRWWCMDCEKEDKMEDIKGITDISGFGGIYEKTCQNMLQAGYGWLCNENPDIELKAYVYKDAYDILGTPKTKELSKVVLQAAEGDCSSAMHQAVMQHLLYIHKHGVEEWKKRVQDNA